MKLMDEMQFGLEHIKLLDNLKTGQPVKVTPNPNLKPEH